MMQCPRCKQPLSRKQVGQLMAAIQSPAKVEASRRNGSVPTKPGSRPRGRPRQPREGEAAQTLKGVPE